MQFSLQSFHVMHYWTSFWTAANLNSQVPVLPMCTEWDTNACKVDSWTSNSPEFMSWIIAADES